MLTVSVTIKKVSTSESRTLPDEQYSLDVSNLRFLWADGNYSCDCNRAIFFDRPEDDEAEYPCSDGAYLVKVVADGEVILDEIG